MTNKDGVPAWKRVQFIDTQAPKNKIFTWGDNFKRGDFKNKLMMFLVKASLINQQLHTTFKLKQEVNEILQKKVEVEQLKAILK